MTRPAWGDFPSATTLDPVELRSTARVCASARGAATVPSKNTIANAVAAIPGRACNREIRVCGAGGIVLSSAPQMTGRHTPSRIGSGLTESSRRIAQSVRGPGQDDDSLTCGPRPPGLAPLVSLQTFLRTEMHRLASLV